MNRSKILFFCAGAVLAALLLCSCTSAPTEPNRVGTASASAGQQQPAPSQPSGSLTIYSALPEEELPVYLHAFTKDTGIPVSCERLSAGEMMRRAEQERDDPQVSVLLGGTSEYYENAAQRGLIEPYQSEELHNVPEAYCDPAGYWNPIYIGVIGFACDQVWFERTGTPYPHSWEDLLDPALEGRIVMASPQSSGTSYTVLAALMHRRDGRISKRLTAALPFTRPPVWVRYARWNAARPRWGSCFRMTDGAARWTAILWNCNIRQTAPQPKSVPARWCAAVRPRNRKTPAALSTGSCPVGGRNALSKPKAAACRSTPQRVRSTVFPHSAHLI